MKRAREDTKGEDQGLCGTTDDKLPLEDRFTPFGDIEGIVKEMRDSFQAGTTLPLEKRKEQLLKLRQLIDENKAELAHAVGLDMNRHPTFAIRTLIGCVQSTDLLLQKLDEWAAPRQLESIGSNACQVRYVPCGVVLIIGTWNFPNSLVWKPLASALGAGNTVIVKLNEFCENSSRVMERLIKQYFDPAVVRTVLGGIPETTEVLRQHFDVIFYTGSTGVGKVVMAAAAKHLTPCILELGGKNPVIVSRDCNVTVAARKIIDGRLKNAGQFCVAPDYVLCDEEVQEQLVNEMKQAIREYFTDDPRTCDSFGRIISKKHTARIAKLLEENHGGEVVVGGTFSIEDRYVAPTIVVNPKPESALRQEEVFGPVLTIVTVKDYKHAMSLIQHQEPLALYLFTRDDKITEYVVNHSRSGGVCVNDVIIHMLNEVLPFGGFGTSGMGSYHGEFGFKAFSHEKAVMIVPAEDTGAGRFPPYPRL